MEARLRSATSSLRISVVTVVEVRDGVQRARRAGATRNAAELATWREGTQHHYSPRLLPFDLAAARIAGRLADEARARGHNPGFADIAIAATAQMRGYIVLTRNMRHFAPLGGLALDPFVALPPLTGSGRN